jgi:hypothetical protein
MTERLLTIDPNTTRAEGGNEELRADPGSRSWSFVPKRVPRRTPLFIPRGQTYYWTHEWRNGEAEADDELRRGEAQIFDDPADALRWLDSPEE